MGALWNLPARYEGPYCHLGKLIREEAHRHVDVDHDLHDCRDDCCLCAKDPADHMRHEETQIWGMVKVGWARPLEDWSGMVFWDPYKEQFAPWSAAMQMQLKDLGDSLGSLKNAQPYTGREAVPEASEGAYVGKERVH